MQVLKFVGTDVIYKGRYNVRYTMRDIELKIFVDTWDYRSTARVVRSGKNTNSDIEQKMQSTIVM